MKKLFALSVGLACSLAAAAPAPHAYHLDFEVLTGRDEPVHAQVVVRPGSPATLTRGDLEIFVTAKPGALAADGAETADLAFRLKRGDHAVASSRIILKLGQEGKMSESDHNGQNLLTLTVTPTASDSALKE